MTAFKFLLVLISLLAICMICVSCQTDIKATSGETTLPPIQACYQEALATDSTLQDCDSKFNNVLSNTIESVEAICLSNCSRLVAQNLHCCRNAGGQASVTTQSGDLISIIQKGCAVDSEHENTEFNSCGDLIDWNLNPAYNLSLVYANGNCSGETDCANPKCRAAVEALGCCAEFAHLFGVLQNITRSTLDSCNVAECLPLPFVLSPCGAGSPTTSTPLVIVLSLVLLAMIQLF